MITRATIPALLLCMLTSGCRTNSPRQQPRAATVEGLFAPWDRSDSPGAAVVVVADGTVLFQRGFGSANLETRAPITADTAFDAASVAKQFTGLAVAMLIEQGKLSLDDEIRKHLPDVPNFGKPITVGHLLYHTSGLRDWPETLGLSGFDAAAVIHLDTILEMVRRQQELDFMPGEEYQYCNTSYNLLAAAVARVTGKSFRQWTDTRIFQPLGMTQTHFCEDPTALIPSRAESYIPAGNGKFKRALSQLAAQGSSSLFVTANDMSKWLRNFQTQRVGGKSAFERMYQPGKLNSGGNIDYGFGLALDKYHGDTMVSHGGAWAGYRSFLLHIPEKNFGVAILSNAGDMNTGRLARKIADLYLGHSPAPEPPVASTADTAAGGKVEPATWDAYVGTYRLGKSWLLEITREGDQLRAQATREDKVKMTPVSDSKFFVPAYGAAVEFVREESGPVKHLLYRGIRAPRLQLPDLSPARLQSYAGDYWSEELRVAYRIEARDGQLGVRHRSGEWIRLLPTGADQFDLEQGHASIEFTRNGASGITELKVSGGRIRNVRFLRGPLPHRDKRSVATIVAP